MMWPILDGSRRNHLQQGDLRPDAATHRAQMEAEVEMLILDTLWGSLPRPTYGDEDAEVLAKKVYSHIFARSVSGQLLAVA